MAEQRLFALSRSSRIAVTNDGRSLSGLRSRPARRRVRLVLALLRGDRMQYPSSMGSAFQHRFRELWTGGVL